MTGGLLNAPNTAVYQKPTEAQSKNSIASYQMLSYALTNFATVAEAKKGFQDIMVNSSVLGKYKGVVQVRMTLHDAAGKSIVVEYLSGKLTITDNPVGVMTNDPEFTWHLKNVGNYVNLTPVEKEPIVLDGEKFQPPSSGSGLHGLPGDSLSTSRFIRAFAYVLGAPEGDGKQQVNNMFHIVNNFDIPPGSIRLSASNPYGGGAGGYEITEWITVGDAKNLKYYVRMYENPSPQMIDMNKIDMNAKEIKFIKMNKVPSIQSLN
jgi:choloylglycine hydrolase